MKVLVTGGAVFIGSHVVRQLLYSGHEVTVLDNLSSGYRSNLVPEAEFVECDVRDPHAVLRATRAAEVVFHMAASVGNKRGMEGPSNDATTNVLGTLNVLEAARAEGCRKVVYASSAAIFGEPRMLPIPDDHPTAPSSPYGVSKLAGEGYMHVYSGLYGFETVALRYFNVYGERQRLDPYGNVIPIFIARALNGESLTIFGDGLQTRDFVHATDVAKATIAAATAGVKGAFNVGSGVALTIRALAESVAKMIGCDTRIEYGPPRPGDVLHSRAEISGLRHATGFAPSCALEQGLREYVTWYEQEVDSRVR